MGAELPVDVEAIELEMAALVEGSVPVSPRAREAAEQLMARGIAANDRRDYDRAIDLYRQALEKYPTSGILYYELALTQQTRGDSIAALENTFRALALDDTLEYAYVLQASLEDDLGYPEQALESYDRLLEKQPESFLGLLNKGITLTKLSRYPEAETAYHAARKIDLTHPSPFLHLGIAARLQGFDYDEETFLEEFLLRGDADPRKAAVTARLKEIRDQRSTVTVDENTPFLVLDIAVRSARALWKSQKHRELHPEARGYRLTYEEEKEVLQAILLAGWKEEKAKDPSVSHDYYDFLLKIDEAGFFDEFIYHQRQREIGPAAQNWLAAHRDRVDAFLAWAQGEGLAAEDEEAERVPEIAAETTGDEEKVSETLVLEDGDLPALVFTLMEKSGVTYSVRAAAADTEDFFAEERRRWSTFRLPQGEALDCDFDLATSLDSSYTSPINNVLIWARCYGPGDDEWNQLRLAGRLGVAYHDLSPDFRGSIEPNSEDEIDVAFPIEGPTEHSWFAYVLTKALWRGETTLQDTLKMNLGTEPSLEEEVLALRATIAGYENSLAGEDDEKLTPDPYFETLREVRDSDLLEAFAMFEILHKRYGVSLRTLSEDAVHSVDRYLLSFVFKRK